MTLEEKKLLLKDLCARLPYNVKCYYQFTEKDCTIVGIWGVESVRIEDSIGRGKWETVEVIKPYLRPMSSMTDEEKEECASIFNTSLLFFQFKVNEYGDIESTKETNDYLYYDCELMSKWIDWLNEHHFDYRGLIDKGLAIEIKNN